MAGNKVGNIMGTRPVIGNKSDGVGTGTGDGTVISLLKRILARGGLGGFDFGFDGAFDVYNEKSVQKLYEIEKHFHNRERWFGVAAAAVGETHIADEMNGSISTFQLVSGNSAFGSWVQLLGSNDTPFKSSMMWFDAHRFLVSAINFAGVYVIQLVVGESVDISIKLAKKEYTITPFTAATVANDAGIENVMSIRIPVGQKIWARTACVGQNAKTINFYFGIHEYLY